MNNNSLDLFCEKPCRFRMLGGHDIYGVIWKDTTEQETNYYFSSSEEYNTIQQVGKPKKQDRTPINIDDIVAAEMLQGIIPGKDMFK